MIWGKTTKMDGFIMENPINMDDLGVPLFLETPTYFQGLSYMQLLPNHWNIFFQLVEPLVIYQQRESLVFFQTTMLPPHHCGKVKLHVDFQQKSGFVSSFPAPPLARNGGCEKGINSLPTRLILLMATRNPVNSPLEVGSSFPLTCSIFFLHPNGGWEWDFWTINSTSKPR